MDETVAKIRDKFKDIRQMGYVKAISNNLNGGGLTFEKLIGATAENLEYPDFEGIEIKTRRSYSKYPITLFSANPDGEYLFEIERLKNTYGYPDKKNKNFKVFNMCVNGNQMATLGWSTKYKLKVDYEKKKIFLCIYDQYDFLIEEEISWSFEMLEEKIKRKMNYLAVVNCWDTKKDNQFYYKFYKMEIFKLKSFNDFILLLENGIICVVFGLGVYYTGEKYGKMNNHGVRFSIKYENITLLYDKIVSI